MQIEHQHKLLNIYDKYMHLKICVADQNNETSLLTSQLYIDAALSHNEKICKEPMHIDAGFDVFSEPIPNAVTNMVYTFDFNITCSAQMICDTGKQYNTGYYMYPRSSLSKTTLRLANSTGIIDAGYRGHLIGKFDVLKNTFENFELTPTPSRLVQICAPGLVPIYVEIVDNISKLGEKTSRGCGGFGSTGF